MQPLKGQWTKSRSFQGEPWRKRAPLSLSGAASLCFSQDLQLSQWKFHSQGNLFKEGATVDRSLKVYIWYISGLSLVSDHKTQIKQRSSSARSSLCDHDYYRPARKHLLFVELARKAWISKASWNYHSLTHWLTHSPTDWGASRCYRI